MSCLLPGKMLGDWTLSYSNFEPKAEGARESLCAVGNGYFVTRGASPESVADDIHYPGTYLACGYNRLETEIAGRTVENEDLVNMPNWLCLIFKINGGSWFDVSQVRILSYQQELDMKHGILHRHIRFEDSQGHQTTLKSRCFVHMRRYHLAALETLIVPENWSGTLFIRTALDGRVVNAGVAGYKDLNNKHLEHIAAEVVNNETIFLKMQTCQSEIRVVQCARTQIFQSEQRISAPRQNHIEPEYVAQDCELSVSAGDIIRIEKIMALYTSRDNAISECGLEAQRTIANVSDFESLLTEHAEMWHILWQHFDIGIDLDDIGLKERPLMLSRLNIFHLLQTVSLTSIDHDVGVPARGWHGEAYRGHIFWDDLFIFPYLNFRMPEISRALLLYRYRRLNEARRRASECGYKGAMYPWQSGSDGTEETPELLFHGGLGKWIPDYTHMQRHVSSAVAFNIWRYYQTSGDMEFLNFYGAEMILEIARFWASCAVYNKDLDRYEILHVVGPDEFHDKDPISNEPGVNNNTYTNVMAVWTLCCALKLLQILPQDRRHALMELLHLRHDDIHYWEDVSSKMRVIIQEDAIISQFEGYEKLKELDWDYYRQKVSDEELHNIEGILESEGEDINQYKVSKQADLLMLFYLFSYEELKELFERMGYSLTPEMIPLNVEYYLNRTAHGSTLSRLVYSWVSASIDRAESWTLFLESLESDYEDIHKGSTKEGIHLGAMAGTVDIAQRCYTGIVPRNDVLWVNPLLPKQMKRLHFRIRYRGHSLELDFKKDVLRVSTALSQATEMQFGFIDRIYKLSPGETLEFSLVHAS